MDNYNKLAEESTDDTDPIPQNESLVSNDNEPNNDAESVENDGAKTQVQVWKVVKVQALVNRQKESNRRLSKVDSNLDSNPDSNHKNAGFIRILIRIQKKGSDSWIRIRFNLAFERLQLKFTSLG